MVCILEGLPYFVFPDKIKAYLTKLLDMPDSTLRAFGLLAMLTGLILLYIGRT
jgi:uncharacterized protein YjeT (DUF2065 family)